MKRSGLLRRVRINKILSSVFEYPLSIVEAPMGYGKTTAVMEFIKSENCPSMYIQFTKASEGCEGFWIGFIKEITRYDRSSGSKLKGLGFPANASQMEKVLSILNYIDFEKRTVFVIDDYHLCKCQGVSRFIKSIADESLDNLHILLVTRDTTNIDFTEMLAKGECCVISQQQLKFDRNEICSYCRMMDETISDTEIQRILEYTDGWVSFMYIVLLGAAQGIPIGMDKSMDELIENTLFNTYDHHIQDFLMKLSILDDFSEKMAFHITKDSQTHEILKKLFKENAFIIYDERTRNYRIHNVLLDFLRIRQHFAKSELEELNRRIGDWYLSKKEFMSAYEYFYKAGDYEYILSLLNDPHNIGKTLIRFVGASEMFQRLPEEIFYKYPVAYLQFIFMSILKGDERAAVNCLKRLDRLQKVYEEIKGIDDKYRNRIFAEILVVKKFTCFNHLKEITDISDRAIELLKGEKSYIMQREDEFTFGSPHLIYIYFREQGTFKQILELAKNKFSNHSKLSDGCGTGSEYLAQGEYALETGDFEHTELYSLKAIYMAETKTQQNIIICAKFNLIRLYIYQNKIDKALEMMKEFNKKLEGLGKAVLNTTVDLCKGYIYSNTGSIERIPEWIMTGNMERADLFYQGIGFNYLVYGKAVMASGNYLKLEVLSESFKECFAVFSNQLGFIHNGIFEAAAKYKLYGMDSGRKALERTLAMGQADGIIMPFVESYTYLKDMIDVIVQENPKDNFVKRIQNCGLEYIKILKSIGDTRASLSSREVQVLSLTAEGFKRDEIAEKLFMSQSTVKKHLQNIYGKLGVNSKFAAIKIAREYGLLN